MPLVSRVAPTLVVLAALVSSAPAAALPQFEVNIPGGATLSGPNPVSTEFSSSDGCRVATAVAGYGGAGVAAAQVCGGPVGSFQQPTPASAKVTFDDFIITSSDPGLTGVIVDAAFRAEGSVNLFAGSHPVLPPGASATFQATAWVNGLVSQWRVEFLQVSGQPGTTTVASNFPANCQFCLTPSGVGGTFLVPGVFIPVNVPFSVSMELYVDAATTVNALSEVYARDTLAIASGMPFLSGLPAGATVNSVQAGVVDNQLVVPEPSVAALLAVGWLALRRRGA